MLFSDYSQILDFIQSKTAGIVFSKLISGEIKFTAIFELNPIRNDFHEINDKNEIIGVYGGNYNWCKQGKLQPYGIGNRVYFKRADVEESLTRIY